jgi:hypothetical protein
MKGMIQYKDMPGLYCMQFNLLLSAVLHAIQFAFVIGIRCVEMELGCYELVDLLHSDGPCLAPIGNLVDDILVSLKVSIIINWLINPRTFM